MTIDDYLLYIDNRKLELLKKDNFHDYLKQKIFEGKIIIFKNLNPVLKIVKLTDQILKNELNEKEINYLNNSADKINIEIFKDKFVRLQKLLKTNIDIKNLFYSLFILFDFDLNDTFSDLICLRYASSKKNNIGSLKFTEAHRDTWASNFQEQVNWWLPVNKTDYSNTIFLCPSLFKIPVKNNSCDWSFSKYIKNKSNYPSTPIVLEDIENKKIIFKLNPGDLLCFSGSHIHGSNEGISSRISLETRTVCLKDSERFSIPKNIDGNYSIKHNNWFQKILNYSLKLP